MAPLRLRLSSVAPGIAALLLGCSETAPNGATPGSNGGGTLQSAGTGASGSSTASGAPSNTTGGAGGSAGSESAGTATGGLSMGGVAGSAGAAGGGTPGDLPF